MSLLGACCTPIAVIENNPQFFDGKNVVVKGKVCNTLRLEDLSFFTLKSYNNYQNVVTENFLPVIGDNIKVRGTVQAKFYYQRDSICVVHEKVKQSNKKLVINQFVK